MNLTVFGIDPSLTATGMVVDDDEDRTAKVIKSKANRSLMERVESIALVVVEEVVCRPQPWLAVVESLPTRGAFSLGKIGPVNHVIQYELWKIGCPIVLVSPTGLKMWATGNGDAKKPAMISVARAHGYPGKNADEADAWLLADIGIALSAGGSEDAWRQRQEAMLTQPCIFCGCVPGEWACDDCLDRECALVGPLRCTCCKDVE